MSMEKIKASDKIPELGFKETKSYKVLTAVGAVLIIQ